MEPLIWALAGLPLFQLYGLIFSMGWLLFFSLALVTLLRTRRLEKSRFIERERWPRLSIVIAARDEAGTLPGAVRTLLDQDYLEMELILVDDRSTDGTGLAVDDLAASLTLAFKCHRRIAPSLFLPAGFFLMFLMQARAGIKCLARGGIEWRGTFYPLNDLRTGRRVGW